MPSLYEKQNVLCASQDTHTEDQSLSLDTVIKWTIGFFSFFLLDFRKAKGQRPKFTDSEHHRLLEHCRISSTYFYSPIDIHAGRDG